MLEVLNDVNGIAGVRGSMVVTRDGMVVASQLGHELDEEKVAAMASSMITSVHQALSRRGLDLFRRLVLNATQGKMVFTDTGEAYLVVVMEKDIDLGPTVLEIESAAHRVHDATRIRSQA